jgi:hypothetical protein
MEICRVRFYLYSCFWSKRAISKILTRPSAAQDDIGSGQCYSERSEESRLDIQPQMDTDSR